MSSETAARFNPGPMSIDRDKSPVCSLYQLDPGRNPAKARCSKEHHVLIHLVHPWSLHQRWHLSSPVQAQRGLCSTRDPQKHLSLCRALPPCAAKPTSKAEDSYPIPWLFHKVPFPVDLSTLNPVVSLPENGTGGNTEFSEQMQLTQERTKQSWAI